MKPLWLFALLWLPLLILARDNPFKPVITPQESGKVSDVPAPDFFNHEQVVLPSSARKLISYSVRYLNMDGSTGVIERELDKDIDWHFPIILAQSRDKLEVNASVDSQPVPVAKAADEIVALPTAPAKTSKPIIQQHKTFEPLPFIAFMIENRTLLVKNSHPIIRDFALAEPSKVVMDFERKSNFYSKTIPTGMDYFKEIAVGNHDGYYRVAILLDGQYRYRLEKTDEGYRLILE